MTMTDQQASGATDFNMGDLSTHPALREPDPDYSQGPPTATPEIRASEITQAFATRARELAQAAGTPLFAETIAETQVIPTRSPELPKLPIALQILQAGETILDKRNTHINLFMDAQLSTDPKVIETLARIIFKKGVPLDRAGVTQRFIKDERKIGGRVFKREEGQESLEWEFHFERINRDGISEDEWIFHDLSNDFMIRYIVQETDIFKIVDGKPYALVRTKEKDELADLVGAVQIYYNRVSKNLYTDDV